MLKKLLFAALLLIFIGVGGSIISYSSSKNSSIISERQSIDFEKIAAIKINTVSTNVEVIASKKHKEAIIELEGKTNEANMPKLLVKAEDTQLIIALQEGTESKWINFSPNFAPSTLTLKLYVPEKIVDDIEFSSVSANLYVENVRSNTFKLSSTSGDIDGENVQFNKAQIKTISGDLDLEKILGEVAIKTVSGNITLTMTDLIHPMQIHSTSGDVEIIPANEPTDVTFKVKSVSGDINILEESNKSTAIGKGTSLVEITTTSGDISVESY